MSVHDSDVVVIDRYADEHGLRSRSGVVQQALVLVRANELGDEYAAAWDDWSGQDAASWEAVVGDGLDGAAR